jgi:hypothetical protein
VPREKRYRIQSPHREPCAWEPAWKLERSTRLACDDGEKNAPDPEPERPRLDGCEAAAIVVRLVAKSSGSGESPRTPGTWEQRPTCARKCSADRSRPARTRALPIRNSRCRARMAFSRSAT